METTTDISTVITKEHKTISNTLLARISDMILGNHEVINYVINNNYTWSTTEAIGLKINDRVELSISLTTKK